ncbi:MAG: hypothetical protein JW779_15340 [Candidatus Thorarchaeota archaeon]|nr:hypothetical protein [Candidatus Thorarchaeota archaeon]
MRLIAQASNIKIHSPDDAYFSFYNSPYTGHSLGTAVDIYPKHQEWKGPVPSPVAGVVEEVRKMKMGQPKNFPTEDFDYAIGIRPENKCNDIVRIMHTEPSVKKGERIELGDDIGKALRSRYFNYWTGPHYHVEVLPHQFFSRASKSHPLDLPFYFEERAISKNNMETEFLITAVTEDNVIGHPLDLDYSNINDLSGLSAVTDYGRTVGILDGGLSHYRHGGIIGGQDCVEGMSVGLFRNLVGQIQIKKPGSAYFIRGPRIISNIDGFELLGLSCFIYPKQYLRKGIPQIILIPKIYGELKKSFEGGDVALLQINQRTLQL